MSINIKILIFVLLLLIVLLLASLKSKSMEKEIGEIGFDIEPSNQYHTINTEPQTANFKISEWTSKAGNKVPVSLWGNLQKLMDNLEVLRAEFGKPVTITPNGGYRTKAEQMRINSKAPNSLHIKAMAADIKVSGISASKVHATIERLISEGKMDQGGLGKYNTFTHYDVRGNAARW